MHNWLTTLQLWDLRLEGVSPSPLCLCGDWGYSKHWPCTWTTLELWMLTCLPCLTLLLALLCSSAFLLAAVRWGKAHLHWPGPCCFLDFVLEPMTVSSASVSIILSLWLHLYSPKLCQPQWAGEGVVNLWNRGSFCSGPDPGRPPSSSLPAQVLLNLCQPTIPEPPWIQCPVPKQVSLWRFTISLGCVSLRSPTACLKTSTAHWPLPLPPGSEEWGLCSLTSLPLSLSLPPPSQFYFPILSGRNLLSSLPHSCFLPVVSDQQQHLGTCKKQNKQKKKQVIRTQSKPSKS